MRTGLFQRRSGLFMDAGLNGSHSRNCKAEPRLHIELSPVFQRRTAFDEIAVANAQIATRSVYYCRMTATCSSLFSHLCHLLSHRCSVFCSFCIFIIAHILKMDIIIIAPGVILPNPTVSGRMVSLAAGVLNLFNFMIADILYS